MEYDNNFKHRGDRPAHNWGDYQFVDHGYDQLAADPTAGIAGKVPGLDQLTAVEMRGRLQFIRSDLKPALVQALAFTSLGFPPEAPVAPGTPRRPCVQGFAEVLLTGQTDDWISRYVGSGNVVLMALLEATQGKGVFMICHDVKKVVELATAGYLGGDLPAMPHGWAILEGPAQLLNQAIAMSVPSVPKPPAPALPGPPAEGALPDWALPAAVGVGALGLIALVLSSRKKFR